MSTGSAQHTAMVACSVCAQMFCVMNVDPAKFVCGPCRDRQDAFFRGAAAALGVVGLGIAMHDNAPLRCDECGDGALWDWRRTWPVFCNETCAGKWWRRNIG